MEREVASTITLAVTLIALSIVITLVMQTVRIGNIFKGEIIENASDLKVAMATGELNSLVGNDTIMPKASIYYIVSKEYEGINSITYTYKNSMGIEVTEVFKINQLGKWSLNGDIYAADQYILACDILDRRPIQGRVLVHVERIDRGIFDLYIKEI